MSTRAFALNILAQIESQKSYAQLALPSALAKSSLDQRDRALVTELVYGIVRQKLSLDWLIERFSDRPADKMEPRLRDLLRLSFYQLIYLDKIPDHAAVDTSVELAKARFNPAAAKFVNALSRRAIRDRSALPWPDRIKDLSKFLSVYHSHPQWLVDLWLAELGKETAEDLLKAGNSRPKVTLRVNTLKATAEELLDILRRQGVDADPGRLCPEAIILAGQAIPENVISDGLAYAQNEASIAVGRVVMPAPGETVIDFCAAPGGKTTHLAQLMNDTGQILAIDIHQSRMRLINENCGRLGVDIVETIAADASAEMQLPPADHVLVDAPCSGLGVLARRPDSRWQKEARDIPRLADLQARILTEAAKDVKPGGFLTYSVCTITNAETTDVVARFMTDNPDFRPVPIGINDLDFPETPYARLWPHIHGTDGMFIAKFNRTS